MTQVFVFTAGNPEARQHLADSIQEPIDEEIVFANFPEAHHEELARIREAGHGFYAWGAVPGPANRRTWEAIDRDDYVLCVYDNAYHYVARVLAKYDNRELAEAVWGTNDQDQTWRHMYFLTKPEKVYRRVSELANYLNAGYFGFTQIHERKLRTIADEYGAIEEFIDHLIGPGSGDEEVSDLETVLSWIRNLRTQPSPSGRFYYKPLILLAALNRLEKVPDHPNSLGYDELLTEFRELAVHRGAEVRAEEFSQPYVRLKNDTNPLRIWIPQTVDGTEIDDARANRPRSVREHAPSVKIDDSVWPIFASPREREAIRREINTQWPPPTDSERRWWWVNQGATYTQERDGGYLWAPKESKGGRVLSHHADVLRLRTGDVILHYAKGALRAVSEVGEAAKEALRPSELPEELWDTEGHLVRAQYHELSAPFSLEDIPLELRIAEGGPFTRQGSVKQGYLYPLSRRFVRELRELSPEFWPAFAVPQEDHESVWLFQANPKQWNLEEKLRAAQVGDEDDWTVSRYREEMQPGDQVILWQGGSNAGVYALGKLVGEPFERDRPPWRPTTSNGLDVEWATGYRFTRILEEPIRKEVLLEHPVLRNMQVLRAPQGTNFKVTDEEWSALQTLLDGGIPVEEDYVEPDFNQIFSAVLEQGIKISERSLRRYHLGLKSRGFVILSGVSGGGKTWLTEAYARAVGAKYVVVPVAPNWTTNEDLLGYFNPLDDQYHDTRFSRFLRAAAAAYERAQGEGRLAKPYHLILDEMNLARVEYYFAKFLSAMEVRARYGTATIELGPEEQLLLPPNLRFSGTVNVDETTHGFADKVYDRAQLIELEASREAILEHIGEAPYREVLIEVWDVTYPVAPFAFRVLDEIAAYVSQAEALGVNWQEALDEQLLQKVLPKLKGTDIRVSETLEWLVALTDGAFPLSHAKVTKMLDEFRQHGFASYF